jgi:hypothetical protein
VAHNYKDFAFGKRGIPSLKTLLIVMGLALAVVAGFEWVYHKNVVQPREAARLSTWTISGPPCPLVDEAEYQLRGGARAKKTTDFAFKFTRLYGDVACTWLGAKDLTASKAFVVCQFSGPNVVRVETPKGVFNYAPGVGRPIAIEVRQGEPRCVMTAKFTG